MRGRISATVAWLVVAGVTNLPVEGAAPSCRDRCRGAITRCIAFVTGEWACPTQPRSARRACLNGMRLEKRTCRQSILAACAQTADERSCSAATPYVETCKFFGSGPVNTNPEWTMALSLDGPGFFVLQAGDVFAYARRDEVLVTTVGGVVDHFGLPLVASPLDESGVPAGYPGPINVGFATAITIDPRGILTADWPGGTTISYQLSVAGFLAPALLRRCTDDIFRPTIGSGPAAISVAQAQGNGSVVTSGALR